MATAGTRLCSRPAGRWKGCSGARWPRRRPETGSRLNAHASEDTNLGRIIFLTQAYLPENTILGVTQEWVHALARRSDGVDVIALSGVPDTTMGDRVRVHSLGKERGTGRLGQLARFYASLARTLPAASAVFVHMVPRYAVLAFPLALAARRPVGLWYAQGGVSSALKAAGRIVDHIFTPTRDSFPLEGGAVGARVRVTGHGVNTDRYTPHAGTKHVPGRLLAAGRLSPSKHYEALIAALPDVRHPDMHLRIASGSLYATADSYQTQLRQQIARLGLQERVCFLGAVPYDAMPEAYRGAHAFAHTSGTGSLDKVVLEAMACQVPVISTAPSSRALLNPVDPVLTPTPESPALAESLSTVLEWPETRRRDAGAALRDAVLRGHSLERWADQVAAYLGARSKG